MAHLCVNVHAPTTDTDILQKVLSLSIGLLRDRLARSKNAKVSIRIGDSGSNPDTNHWTHKKLLGSGYDHIG